jgi:hypothetical protein
MDRLGRVAEVWTSLRGVRMLGETYLLLVQASPVGDERRTGVMDGEDVYGAAKLGGQHDSCDA